MDNKELENWQEMLEEKMSYSRAHNDSSYTIDYVSNLLQAQHQKDTEEFVEKIETKLRMLRRNLERWESGEVVLATNTPSETEKEIYALHAVIFQLSDLLSLISKAADNNTNQ